MLGRSPIKWRQNPDMNVVDWYIEQQTNKIFHFCRQIWSDVCISGRTDAEIDTMATSMARSLINKALLENQKGLQRIQEVSFEL